MEKILLEQGNPSLTMAAAMSLYIFLLLLMSHVMGDAVLTSHKLAVLKRSQRFLYQVRAISYHSTVHAVIAGLLLLLLDRLWLRGAILVLTLHFFIDFLRCRVEIQLYGAGRIHVKRSELLAWLKGKSGEPEKMRVGNLWPWFLIHFLDQGAHLGALYGIALVV